jgi:parvulin-like peptidyl-prolyl isomerase
MLAQLLRMSRTTLLLATAFCASRAFAEEPFAVVQGPRGTVTTSLFSEENQGLPVAKVEEQVVTLQQFSQALAAAHGAHGNQETAGKADFHPILERLIGARLIGLEAHEMGLDDLPELKKAVDSFAALELRRAMLRKLMEGATPDPARGEGYFRDAVREWKLDSLLFTQEAAAKQVSAALKQGKEFGGLAAQALQAKQAVRSEGEFVAAPQMLPQVAAAARDLFAGQVSEPVQVTGGWAVFRVVAIRYPENAPAREEATERASSEAREAKMKAVYPSLLARRARLSRGLLAKLDFEAKKPGFAALAKDQRPLAKIRGGKDITVADLAREITKGFFHGLDDAIRQKRVNELKEKTFENLLRGELLAAEARSHGIARTPAYLQAVAEYRESLVFGEFVRRVVLPGLEVKEDEGRAWYQAHQADYALPAFYTLDSLTFSSAQAAQTAAAKLRAGTDFKWLENNAEGRVAGEKSPAATVSAASLPEALRAQLTVAKPGDVKLFESDDKHQLAVVRQVVPKSFRPYLEVRGEIAKKLSGEKLNRALAEWVEKLRKAHDVQVYLRQIGS